MNQKKIRKVLKATENQLENHKNSIQK